MKRFLIVLATVATLLSACGIKSAEYPSLWEIYDPASFTPGDLRIDYDVIIEPITESELPGYGQKTAGVAIYMVAEVVSDIDPDFSALYVTEVYPFISTPNGYTVSGRSTFFRVYQKSNELTTADHIWNPIVVDAAAVMSTLCVDTAQKMSIAYFCPVP